jgi:hypothetical protein
MPQVRFEPMIPVFERSKTVLALDRAASAIGMHYFENKKNIRLEYDRKLGPIYSSRPQSKLWKQWSYYKCKELEIVYYPTGKNWKEHI